MRTIKYIILLLISLKGVSQKTDNQLLYTYKSEIQNLDNTPLSTEDRLFNEINIKLAKASNSTDKLEAFESLLNLAEKGDDRAMYLVGVYLKYGLIVGQDLKKSCEYFSRSAKKGNIDGKYGLGFMKYKGLGCEQNYEEAFLNFNDCASLPSCMYMLGLCYRNGFGILQDFDKADHWLNKAVLNGYSAALLEKEYIYSEVSPEVLKALDDRDKSMVLFERDKLIENKFQKDYDLEKATLNSTFNGYYIKYDYSGKYIVQVKNISLKFGNGMFKSQIAIDGCNYFFDYSVKENNLFISGLKIGRDDRYFNTNKDSLLINQFKIIPKILNNEIILIGDISSWSILEKEPERKVEIILNTRINKALDDQNCISPLITKLYPNPSTSTEIVTIEFDILKKGFYQIQVSNIEGKIVSKSQTEFLDIGPYYYILGNYFEKGIYLVTIVSDNEFQNTKMIKL